MPNGSVGEIRGEWLRLAPIGNAERCYLGAGLGPKYLPQNKELLRVRNAMPEICLSQLMVYRTAILRLPHLTKYRTVI